MIAIPTSGGASARWRRSSCGTAWRRPRRAPRAPRQEFAKWQLPERFEFIDAIPRTATGKFKKTALRERFVKTAV